MPRPVGLSLQNASDIVIQGTEMWVGKKSFNQNIWRLSESQLWARRNVWASVPLCCKMYFLSPCSFLNSGLCLSLQNIQVHLVHWSAEVTMGMMWHLQVEGGGTCTFQQWGLLLHYLQATYHFSCLPFRPQCTSSHPWRTAFFWWHDASEGWEAISTAWPPWPSWRWSGAGRSSEHNCCSEGPREWSSQWCYWRCLRRLPSFRGPSPMTECSSSKEDLFLFLALEWFCVCPAGSRSSSVRLLLRPWQSFAQSASWFSGNLQSSSACH